MKKIRVLLANRPRMMREVVRKIIEGQQDMEVVGEVLDPLDILMAVREAEVDAVILALKGSEDTGLCSHLLAQYPNLTIVGLTSGGESAFIEQRCPQRRYIVDRSEANILDALRQAIRSPCRSEEEMAPG